MFVFYVHTSVCVMHLDDPVLVSTRVYTLGLCRVCTLTQVTPRLSVQCGRAFVFLSGVCCWRRRPSVTANRLQSIHSQT